MLGSRYVEQWVIDTIIPRVEPHLEQWIHRFLSSPRGRDLVEDILAESLADLLGPSADFSEQMVLKLIRRLAGTSPGFRQAALEILHQVPVATTQILPPQI